MVIYGNKTTNLAWDKVLSNSPAQVERGLVSFGDEKYIGDNLACMFVQPRADSTTAMVAVVSGSGVTGMRLTTRIPYMNPGIGLPDFTLLDTNILSKGDKGIRLTGFFGLDWSIGSGEFIHNQ